MYFSLFASMYPIFISGGGFVLLKVSMYVCVCIDGLV